MRKRMRACSLNRKAGKEKRNRPSIVGRSETLDDLELLVEWRGGKWQKKGKGEDDG